MRTVLITGSTSGIGLAIATEFARTKEYNIVFNGLETDGRDVAERVGKEFDVPVTFNSANMLLPAELRDMVTESSATFGSIDVLVNNAGIQHVSPVEDFPDEKWIEIIGVNLTSAFYLSKAVWKGMKQKKSGRIINIASAHGLVASEFKSAYVASKHGLVGLTKTLALEGAPFNITANAICPGYVRTKLVNDQIFQQANAHGMSEDDVIASVMLSRQPVKDFISADLIGRMAVFMASEHATSFTGSIVPIDGGWSAW